MQEKFKRQANTFLRKMAESLDISDAQREKAEKRYTAIGNWLGREESSLYKFSPSMYPQGSFLLGTVIKPVTDADEFDVDLVCEVKARKNENSQKDLKEAVGREVKGYAKANSFEKPVVDGKRCWTLEYADSANFHMDVLPALPDGDNMKVLLESKGFDSSEQTKLAIAITDNTLQNYPVKNTTWPVSNPRGYAEWFKSRMETQFRARVSMLAEARKADVADIPEHQVKTPLQRAIQLLKRHRDIKYAADTDNKPISIIITTLAARAYNNEDNLVDALITLIHGMGAHIESIDGIYWVPNPVNPAENFADKWQGNPVLRRNFYEWLEQVRLDFELSFLMGTIDSFADSLRHKLGNKPICEGMKDFEDSKPAFLSKVAGIAAFMGDMGTWLLPKYDVGHRRRTQWKEMLHQVVLVRGYIEIEGKWIEFTKNDRSLPTGCRLRFMAETDTQAPFQAHWQIVNTGRAASRAECLRGEFKLGAAGIGGLKWSETTMYSGMHWVECFIVKNGLLVARSSPFEVNIG